MDVSGNVRAASERPTDWSAPAAPRTVWDRIKDQKVLQWTLAYSSAAYTLLHRCGMVGNALDWPWRGTTTIAHNTG